MPNKRGARSIHTAARYGNIPIINTLIQRGEKVDVTTNVSSFFAFFYIQFGVNESNASMNKRMKLKSVSKIKKLQHFMTF